MTVIEVSTMIVTPQKLSITRKFYKHTLQTNSLHCEEEAHNTKLNMALERSRLRVLNIITKIAKHSVFSTRGVIAKLERPHKLSTIYGVKHKSLHLRGTYT